METRLGDSSDLIPILRDATSTGVRTMRLRLASYAIGFVASVLIARALGPTGRGLYAYPLAILGIIMAVGHLGLEQAHVFFASRGVSLRRLWANAAVASVLIGVVAWLVVTGIYLGLGPHALGALPFAWIAVPILQVPFLLQSLYWANILQLDGRLLTATRAALIGVALHACLTSVLFATGSLTPFRVLLLAWSMNGTAWLLLLLMGMRAGLVGRSLDWPVLRRAVAFGLKAHLGLVFVFLLLRVDQLLVRGYLGYHALGLYSLAATLAELLWLLTDPFAAALLPHQVRATGGDERRLGYAMARMSLLVAMAAATLAWVAAPYAIRFVYGERFVDAVWPFRLLLPGIVALAAQRPLGPIVVKEGRPWLVTVLGLGALALNLLLNVLLLPRMGIAGASVASTTCYVLITVAYVSFTRMPGTAGWRDLLPRPADLRNLHTRVTVARGP